MFSDKLKDVLYGLYEAINRGDYPAVEHIIADDYVEHEPLPLWIPSGREGVKEYIRLLHRAFPDIAYDVRDIAAEGDKVWARISVFGTHREDFEGIPATGKPVQIEKVDIYRFSQHKIIEHWSITDQLALFQQLGVHAILEEAEP